MVIVSSRLDKAMNCVCECIPWVYLHSVIGQVKQQETLPESVGMSLHHRPRISSEAWKANCQSYPLISFNCKTNASMKEVSLLDLPPPWSGKDRSSRKGSGQDMVPVYVSSQSTRLRCKTQRMFERICRADLSHVDGRRCRNWKFKKKKKRKEKNKTPWE